MRVGHNPLKTKILELTHKQHRVILPFWIPNVTDDYFKNQPQVLDWCLRSLTGTIDVNKTAITLINNASCEEASRVAEIYVKKGLIDKYVVRNENRGKLENILAEARASYEEYITISDADFLFYSGWEDAIIDVFKTFKQAGVVSCYPCPNLAFNSNSAWIWSSLRKSGKVVTDSDFDMVEQGLGNTPGKGIYSSMGVRKKVIWRQKQYYLEKGSNLACIGATHALGTMKRDLVQNLPQKKVKYVFKNGYEHEYLDIIAEKMGYYRLSTTKCYAYHMGNNLPMDIIENYSFGATSEKVFPEFVDRNLFLNGIVSRLSALFIRLMRKMRFL